MEKEINGLRISDDLDLLDKEHGITPELKVKLSTYYNYAVEGKKSKLNELKRAIEKYPANPQLKNYLSVLYTQIGQQEKANQVNEEILVKHPSYLFGKLNAAGEYFTSKQFHKIPEVLGSELELKALYPQRDIFHSNELMGFLKCKALYYIGIEKLEIAKQVKNEMQDIDANALDLKVVNQYIMMANMEASIKRTKEEDKNKTKVEVRKNISTEKITEPPVFTHIQINELYKKGLYISTDTIDAILALPRETIIQDLETVLKDSITRFNYFADKCEKEDWNEDEFQFVIHAVFLLGELDAAESIESIFNVLSQSKEYIDLYIGDFLSEGFWEPIYKITRNNLEACTLFMQKPGIYTFSRFEISEMAVQIVFHEPERKNEVLEWFTNVFDFYTDCSVDKNIVDSDLLGFMINVVIKLRAIEIMPTLHKLAENHYIPYSICGSLDEVENAIDQRAHYNYKKELLPIHDRYKQVTTTWAGYNEDENKTDYSSDFSSNINPERTERKIGRNDPCPCGSGKKYKKCCL